VNRDERCPGTGQAGKAETQHLLDVHGVPYARDYQVCPVCGFEGHQSRCGTMRPHKPLDPADDTSGKSAAQWLADSTVALMAEFMRRRALELEQGQA